MRRILIALLMSGAVVVAAPTGAMAAHHRSHHHARHHARSHARKHSRLRHERFGSRDQNQPGNQSGPAGTVTSFANGVLTITLNDGSTVSGNVTDQTEIECMSSTASQQGDDGNDNNDASNQSGDGGQGGSSGGSGDDNGGNGDNGDDNGDNGDNGNGQMCSTAALTTGTPVAEANLELSGSGAVWNRVELITS